MLLYVTKEDKLLTTIITYSKSYPQDEISLFPNTQVNDCMSGVACNTFLEELVE